MAHRPINLNKARKARDKANAKFRANENAIVHGLPKAAKDQARAEAARITTLFDGTKRSPKTPPPDGD